MYSFWQRISTVFNYFSSALFAVLPLIAVLNFLISKPPPSVSLVLSNVTNRVGVEDYFMNKKVLLTDLVMDLDADFSSLFHWNTKQLFLYITIEYETADNGRNQIVFWDKIIRRKDNKRISITGLKSKYPAVDIDEKLPGSKANIKLYWNTVPQVGYLFDTQKGNVSLTVPNVGETFKQR